MARFRGGKSLSCFYCGKKSGLKFDGTKRDFLCKYCDATNYLDEEGEITDPPVATEREAVAVQYAAPQPSPSTQQESIFCSTCLKNQHLFTKSLAQYLPDDPNDPDYPQLERNYYRYRRSLEKRYPQVCGDCAETVEDRIRQAGYTAKTDHLRRMMSLTRGRKVTRRRTKLDWFNTIGKTLWRTGIVLQMLWHFVSIVQILRQRDSGMYDPDDDSLTARAMAWLEKVEECLPQANALMQWSIRASILSAWWNPHFVQVNRGFTRHLLGFTQWYSFQGLIVFFRFIFRGVVDANEQAVGSDAAKLSAHLAMASVMIMIYILASKSIRIDTTPLFATDDKPLTPRHTPRDNRSPEKRKQEDAKTFSELFNDALDSTNNTPQKTRLDDLFPPSPQSPFNPMRPQSSSQPSFGNIGLPNTPPSRPQQGLQYPEEMDWSPITPQHRAVSGRPAPIAPIALTRQPNGRAENQAASPPETKSPFWYKVPAAPVEPARRLRNPPQAAQPKPEPAANPIFSRRGHKPTPSQGDEIDAVKGVEFKQPSFFAPQKDHDASSLADLLSQSFSLGQEQDDVAEDLRSTDNRVRKEQNTPIASSPGQTQSRQAAQTELIALAVLLLIWLATAFVQLPYSWEIQLVVLLVAGLIVLRGTGDISGSMLGDTAPGAIAYVLSVFGVAELAVVCWIGSEVWNGNAEQVDLYGAAALTVILGHQATSMAL